MIQVGEKIGSGTERDVYIHPHDDSLTIKVNRRSTALDINLIEYEYYLSHIADTSLMPYFPRMRGWQETVLGPGLVVDCVRDHNGRISRNLAQAMEERSVSYPDARKKLADIAHIAVRHGVFMRELDVANILVRLGLTKRSFDIVIVDGFGPISRSIKTLLRSRYRFLSRIKARRAWRQQMVLLDAWAGQMLDRGPTVGREGCAAGTMVTGSGKTP